MALAHRRYFAWLFIVSMVLGAGCDRTVVPEGKTESPKDVHQDGTSQEISMLVGENGTPPVSNPPVEPSATDLTHRSSPSGVLPVDTHVDGKPVAANTTPVDNSSIKPTEQKWLTLQQVKSDDPVTMIQYLVDIDRVSQELLTNAKRMDEKAFNEAALHLTHMKLEAAEHLVKLPSATPEQVRLGTKTQLVALSNLTGLKDVQAAKRLEEFARNLVTNTDPELGHQGQVVLFGFEVQNLQNGVVSDAANLVELAKNLLEDSRFRGRVEMIAISNASNVLRQMGFTDEATKIEKIAFDAFWDSPDGQLRNESWNLLTVKSQSVENFVNSLRSSLGGSVDNTAVVAAARDVFKTFPNPVTLEMIAGVVPDLEYSGHVELSRELAGLVETGLTETNALGNSATMSRSVLEEHHQRTKWIGRKLELDGLLDADGKPLKLADIQGKVLLVDFWATWCVPCLQEIPNIRKVYDELSGQGLAVVSINMDTDAEALKQFLIANRFPWPTYRPESGDTRAITEQFGVSKFPFTMMTDKSGNVVRLHVRGDDILTTARQLLRN